MNLRFFFSLLFIGLIAISSCGDPTASGDLLEEDLYLSVFSELLVINQLNEEQLGPVSREYLKEQVFEEYDVTREQFERTHRYFQQQPERQLQRLNKVEEIFTEERDRLQERLNEERKKIADSLSVPDTL